MKFDKLSDLIGKNVHELTDEQIELLDKVTRLYNLGEPLLHYESSGKKNFTYLQVRGDSRKEHIDFNDKLFVLIAHEDTMYSWMRGDGNQVNLVSKFTPKSI